MAQEFPMENMKQEECEMCIPANRFSFAMAYVPDHMFEELYEADIGWDRGTIFKQLDMPFLGYMRGEAK